MPETEEERKVRYEADTGRCYDCGNALGNCNCPSKDAHDSLGKTSSSQTP